MFPGHSFPYYFYAQPFPIRNYQMPQSMQTDPKSIENYQKSTNESINLPLINQENSQIKRQMSVKIEEQDDLISEDKGQEVVEGMVAQVKAISPKPIAQLCTVKSSKKNASEQNQKYGRNICSNIFHIIIKKVLHERDFHDYILKIIKFYNMTITIDQFYSKLYFKQNKLNQYVPYRKILEFYIGHKNKIKENQVRHRQFCKILRIISRVYLKQIHIQHTYNNTKLKNFSKKFHLEEARKLNSIACGTYFHQYKKQK